MKKIRHFKKVDHFLVSHCKIKFWLNILSSCIFWTDFMSLLHAVKPWSGADTGGCRGLKLIAKNIFVLHIT